MACIVERERNRNARGLREEYILAMFLLWVRTPKQAEPDGDGFYDLSEIGSVREVKINRMTPYSVAERRE
jgi:hypothetical protein